MVPKLGTWESSISMLQKTTSVHNSLHHKKWYPASSSFSQPCMWGWWMATFFCLLVRTVREFLRSLSGVLAFVKWFFVYVKLYNLCKIHKTWTAKLLWQEFQQLRPSVELFVPFWDISQSFFACCVCVYWKLWVADAVSISISFPFPFYNNCDCNTEVSVNHCFVFCLDQCSVAAMLGTNLGLTSWLVQSSKSGKYCSAVQRKKLFGVSHTAFSHTKMGGNGKCNIVSRFIHISVYSSYLRAAYTFFLH